MVVAQGTHCKLGNFISLLFMNCCCLPASDVVESSFFFGVQALYGKFMRSCVSCSSSSSSSSPAHSEAIYKLIGYRRFLLFLSHLLHVYKYIYVYVTAKLLYLRFILAREKFVRPSNWLLCSRPASSLINIHTYINTYTHFRLLLQFWLP